MTGAAAGHCEYQLEIGLVDEDFSGEPCGRPLWEDHERCVFHAEVDGKTADDFEDVSPEPGDNFDGAYLRGASLVGVDWLTGSSLVGADLTDANVNGVDLTGTNLMLAKLTNLSAISTNFEGANLEGAIFTNADLRRANLEGARLNGAVLTDVHIGGDTNLGENSYYENEATQPDLGDDHPMEAAAWAYRQFRQVYQANALPQKARRSFVQEKDARRRLAWAEGDYPGAIKWELSRLIMRYGSSPYRILAVSLLVILVAALLFPLTGGIQETQGEQVITYTIDDPANAPQWWIVAVLFKSLYFSVVTFATLGYGDIQPIGQWARLLAGVETILGSLLSALLVFVLARIVTW